MTFNRAIHNDIWQILKKFDSDYLAYNGILFGGGTRIALELSEYRESIDIDFLCADPTSYKAVRSQVSSNSFGALLKKGQQLHLCRDIRADRDAVRSIVKGGTRPIKLEFIHFDHYKIERASPPTLFPVPYIDHSSCFLTKLLANADRQAANDQKDIFDLCIMFTQWGNIPQETWQKADAQYGYKLVVGALTQALQRLINHAEEAITFATNTLAIEPTLARRIVEHDAPVFLSSINNSID
jgi:hypothetical protein